MSNYIYPSQEKTRTSFRLPRIKLKPQPATLEDVLGAGRLVPAYSLVLGMCADDLPLVLDLTDPSPGAFLIAADSGFANTTLLHSIIAGGLSLNTEYELNIHLISPQADDLLAFHRQPNFKVSCQPDNTTAGILIEELTLLAHTRERSGRRTPYHLVCIDSLDILWEALSLQGKMWLEWLIASGPALGIWVLASLEAGYLTPSLYRTIGFFPSRILGRIHSGKIAGLLSGPDSGSLPQLTSENEFTALTGGQALTICILPTAQDPYLSGAV